MSFVDRILGLINEKGITKNKMLTDLKLSKNSIIDWKKRGTIPNGETLQKIADYFNVSIDYLLTGQETNVSDKEQAMTLSNIEQDFIMQYRKYFKVRQLGEPEREELMLDIELLKYFHCLNTIGKKSVIAAARGFCIESDYVNEDYTEQTLA